MTNEEQPQDTANENTREIIPVEPPSEPQGVMPGLGIEVVELDIINDGPPVFDVQVTAPAIPLHVYAVVKRPQASKVVSRHQPEQQGKLYPRIVFSVVPGSAKTTMRIALLQVGDTIPVGVAEEARYLGCFIHPVSSMPISAYQLPYTIDEAVDAATIKIGDVEVAPVPES